MPIIQPESFKALGFLPFQVNPHYLDQKTDDFNGETRDQRLEEFVKMNPGKVVVGLPEGTALWMEEKRLQFVGKLPAVRFETDKTNGVMRTVIQPGKDLSNLL